MDVFIVVTTLLLLIVGVVQLLPVFGLDIRIWGRTPMPLEAAGFKAKPTAKAWIALALCLVSAAMSAFAVYRFSRPKIIEKEKVVERQVPVEKIVKADCPKVQPIKKAIPPKVEPVNQPHLQPSPTTSSRGNNTGTVGGDVNQGPCSNLQVGGSDNQQSTNCTFQDIPPKVMWTHAQDDQNHAVKLRIWVDKPFPSAMFVVTCDKPCEGVSGELDYGNRRPQSVFGPEIQFGNPNDPYRPDLVGFVVNFPATLPPDYTVVATVRSKDGQPLVVKTVGRLTLTGSAH